MISTRYDGHVNDDRTRTLRKRIASAITALRRRHGWSKTELARRAGLDRTTVSKYEAATLTPSLDALDALAFAFGLEAGSLLSWTDAHAESQDGPVSHRLDGQGAITPLDDSVSHDWGGYTVAQASEHIGDLARSGQTIQFGPGAPADGAFAAVRLHAGTVSVYRMRGVTLGDGGTMWHLTPAGNGGATILMDERTDVLAYALRYSGSYA